jgi:GH24 family phage-related lysozyme (muramidase)
MSNQLQLNEMEAKELQKAVDESYYNKAKTRFETNKYGRKFEDLPEAVKTALYSLNYHTGTIGPKSIEKAANDNNYEDLINEFRNYYRSPKMQEGFQGKRRQLEADYMEQQLQTLRGLQSRNPASEQVSEPPVAQPMDMAPEDLEREAARQEVDSTLQDVEENMAPEERGQATQELQGELLRLHKMLATGGDDNIIAGMIDRIIPLVEKSVLNPQESQAMIYRLSQANPEDISNMIQELQVS